MFFEIMMLVFIFGAITSSWWAPEKHPSEWTRKDE